MVVKANFALSWTILRGLDLSSMKEKLKDKAFAAAAVWREDIRKGLQN
jgi:predicted hydrolase (HD superfamily)